MRNELPESITYTRIIFQKCTENEIETLFKM